ncbi:glycerate kinase family protein [Nocardioides sp. GXZ039]|uniref:glycerate kinase family protein n=1 Tax=Nocardioides sp. GXZ039 TaxID=3136018 RepID=UPI0030F419B2
MTGRRLRVLAAPDKFRGTADAHEIAVAVRDAVEALGGSCRVLPLADGGEGTLEALGGANRVTRVTGPLGTPVDAPWRLDQDSGVAVVEMARASGLLLAGGAAGNDPLRATTWGTGELVVAATSQGAREIVICLGGSATTDGGYGALEVILSSREWQDRAERGTPPRLTACCDVATTFVDAAAVFAPQKGASPAQVAQLTDRLRDLAARYSREFGVDVTQVAGTGAAGGLAGALLALGARLRPGFDTVARQVGLREALAWCDLVITGEGRLDSESLNGKVVGGVVEEARGAGKQVVAIVGDRAADVVVPDDVTVVSLSERYGRTRALADPAALTSQVVTEHLTAGSAGATECVVPPHHNEI